MRCDELAIQVIEIIQNDHMDNDGEYGQDYLDDVKREHIQELDTLLKNTIRKWANKNNYLPRHFFVRSIEAIESEGE